MDNIKSIDPKYWGYEAWNFLFAIALTYDVSQKNEYKNFFNQLQYVLPCDSCKIHYTENLKSFTDDVLDSKENLLNWLTTIRNKIYVFQHNNNKQKTLKDNIDLIYNKNFNYGYILLFVFIVIIFLYIVFNK